VKQISIAEQRFDFLTQRFITATGLGEKSGAPVLRPGGGSRQCCAQGRG
jgi:hypothetical protein